MAVSVERDGERVVLDIRGEVDRFTIPELDAILAAVVGQRQASVVVDLARCGFMNHSGLQIIARQASRLRALDATLVIRSPSGIVRRLAAIMGLAELIEPKRPPASGSPDPVPPRRPVDVVTSYDVAHYLGAVSAGDVIDAMLRLVVVLARGTVGGADGASVSLRRQGVLATVAATDQTVSDMDASQYATGEGPCVDASIEGRWFHAESLDTEPRWATFTPRARTLGIRAILSSPLFDRGEPCGALNIYSRRADAFTPGGQTLASTFAAEVSTVLTGAVVGARDDWSWGRFVPALEARETIARAEGVLMERHGVRGDEAHTILRRSSLRAGTPLREQAEDVVGTTQRLLLEKGTETEARRD